MALRAMRVASRGERLRGVHQREAAERQSHALAEIVALHVDQLQRAAAEIADDAVRLDGWPTRRRAPTAPPRACPDSRTMSRPMASRAASRKDGAILRVARGRGGDDLDVAHAHHLAQRAIAAQRLQRLVDALLRQSAGRDDALAEAAHGLFVEDRRRRARQRLIGDETHRIGADVDNGDGLRANPAPPATAMQAQTAFKHLACASAASAAASP